MMVTKHNIVHGITKFIESDMSRASGSTTSKMIMLLAKNVLKKNDGILDVFIENPVAKTLINEEDGKYDISPLVSVLKETASELGHISLEIPKVPFLLPDGDEIMLNPNDIDVLNGYIMEDARMDGDHAVQSGSLTVPAPNA